MSTSIPTRAVHFAATRYHLVTAEAGTLPGPDGAPVPVPAGTGLGAIIWDGLAPFDPPPLTSLHDLPGSAPDAPREIPALRFLERFTPAELFRLEDTGMAMGRAGAPDLFAQLRRSMAASMINLDDVEVVAALRDMEAAGLLATGRAAQILA